MARGILNLHEFLDPKDSMSEETTKPQSGASEAGFQERSGGPRMDKDAPIGEGPRFKGRRRRKVSYLTINKIDTVDYKEINILRRFLNDRGKILPSRQSGNTAKQQRMIAGAIRKAREMALLPYVVTEMGQDRREYGRRERSYDRGPRGDFRQESRAEARTEPQARTEPVEAAPEAPATEE